MEDNFTPGMDAKKCQQFQRQSRSSQSSYRDYDRKHSRRQNCGRQAVDLRRSLRLRDKNHEHDRDRKREKENPLQERDVIIPYSTILDPELTSDMESTISTILNSGEPDDVIVKSNTGAILYRKDFKTLVGLNWVNDSIIDSYLDLIVHQSKNYNQVFSFNTFFYTNLKKKGYQAVKKWTRNDDIFKYDLNLVPIHSNDHWSLAVIDHRRRHIGYYDSLHSCEKMCLDILKSYLKEEYEEKKKIVLDSSTYATETIKNIPHQKNGSDCGVFILKYAEFISRNAEITFNQECIPHFRRAMIYELFRNQLL